MFNQTQNRICAYCGSSLSAKDSEDDHVIARQFFPSEEKYRGNLPQVPSCGKCNREKQKCEDSAGVILQFAHDSDASRKVLDDRVPKTLAKNARISRALQTGMHRAWVCDKSGLLLERLVIDINQQELFYINQWFRFVTKGLYHFEMKEPLPKGYDIYLLKPTSQEEFDSWANFLLSTKHCQERQIANGEFGYLYSRNTEEKAFSMWLFVFKSVEVFAFTVSENSPDSLKSKLKETDWKELPPKTKKENAESLIPKGGLTITSTGAREADLYGFFEYVSRARLRGALGARVMNRSIK
jgi:hypothetical protein